MYLANLNVELICDGLSVSYITSGLTGETFRKTGRQEDRKTGWQDDRMTGLQEDRITRNSTAFFLHITWYPRNQESEPGHPQRDHHGLAISSWSSPHTSALVATHAPALLLHPLITSITTNASSFHVTPSFVTFTRIPLWSPIGQTIQC